LEEDSARKVKTSDDGKKIYWTLDRLGIPLIEIATSPDIKNPEQAKEVALKIGDVLRSSKVRRGIGTIRQDVNVSIRNENRVELKGMQDMKTFVKTIENEVLRQMDLSDNKKLTSSEVRNALNDSNCGTEFLRPMPGADRMYPETDLPLLKISRDFINECKKDLPKLRSDIFLELEKKGLNEEMIKLLFKQNKVDDFVNLTGNYRNVNFIAKIILLFPKEISSKLNKNYDGVDEIIMDNAGDVLRAVEKNKITEGDVKDVLAKLVEGESLKDVLSIEKKDLGEVEEFVLKLIKEKPGLNANAYMGLVMKEFRGKIDGKIVMEIIGKFMK
jgi:Glu-tRNA(Gln) amidotransferase subunit E-like FAD-binding protein